MITVRVEMPEDAARRLKEGFDSGGPVKLALEEFKVTDIQLMGGSEEVLTWDKPDSNVIPPITDPMGKHWKQPSTDNILIDDAVALMDERTLKALPEYSATIPTGAYEGKMWKANKRFFHRDEQPIWVLCWYGPHEDKTKVSINVREVIVI